MTVSIRIYSKLGKEHVYTFEGYNTLNNTLTVNSILGCEDVSIANLQLCIKSNEPCDIQITDRSNDLFTITKCFIHGARLDKKENGRNYIAFDTVELKFTNHREQDDEK